MTQLEADFCVVGAGISGMTAAYRLRTANTSVIVLEASPRIGGRVWTDHLTDGTVFEVGAQWVTERCLQRHLHDLMCDLTASGSRFDLQEQYIGGQNIFVDLDGNVGYYFEIPPKSDGVPPEINEKHDSMPPVSDEAKVEILGASRP